MKVGIKQVALLSQKKSFDASRLSVVSFSSTMPQAQSFIISYFGFRFTAVYI